jgi:chromate reductase, NAD(P)H dehydrogenase (quinone)
MADTPALTFLGISGSLRAKSLNTAALRAAADLVPPGVTLKIADLADIPLYHGDVEADGLPTAVLSLRAEIDAADAVLFCTPEYNYSVPGVLKNAIDWASRPPAHPFAGKPIAIMGASPGMLGGARAQYHLRQVFIFMDGKVMNKPEVMIGSATGKFDADGKLTDEPTRTAIAALLVALKSWTLLLRGEKA